MTMRRKSIFGISVTSVYTQWPRHLGHRNELRTGFPSRVPLTPVFTSSHHLWCPFLFLSFSEREWEKMNGRDPDRGRSRAGFYPWYLKSPYSILFRLGFVLSILKNEPWDSDVILILFRYNFRRNTQVLLIKDLISSNFFKSILL